MYRVGLGYDIHRFKKGRTLWLGGVKIPFALGLEGHSDADALLHAITDAILGAAGLPDIGSYFPPGDPETKNIPSSRMLGKAVQEMEKQGYRIVNVDSVILTESPRVAPYRETMRRTIARLVKIPATDVQVKGKTHEQLDAIGQGKALAAQAVVLLKSTSPFSGEVAKGG
jgi:2-C-methyl-D-erythritol 2,4-cyclodiphosphate synthase